MKISSKLSLSSDFVLLWYFTCWNCWIHSELYAGVQLLPYSVSHSLILKLPFSLDPFLCCLYFTFPEVCRFWTSFWRKLGWRVACRIMGHWKLYSIEETQTVVDTEVFLWRIPVVEFSLLARKVKLSLGWKCWERFEWKSCDLSYVAWTRDGLCVRDLVF